MTTETTTTETPAPETRTYYCWDNTCGDHDGYEIEAETPEAAAREFVDQGDYEDGSDQTQWIDIRVRETCGDGEPDEDAEAELCTVTLDPPEPDCAEGEDHDWCSPIELVGGCEENPGVHGHGGGVTIHSVCRHCGAHRHTDTWAQRPDTGEQGLESVRYEPADERSRQWVEEQDPAETDSDE